MAWSLAPCGVVWRRIVVLDPPQVHQATDDRHPCAVAAPELVAATLLPAAGDGQPSWPQGIPVRVIVHPAVQTDIQ